MKVINNTVKSNRLILILLVFRVYLKITELDPPNPIVKQRATIIKKAIKEIRKIHVIRKVNKALRTCNSFSIIYIHDFSLNNPILVYKE